MKNKKDTIFIIFVTLICIATIIVLIACIIYAIKPKAEEQISDETFGSSIENSQANNEATPIPENMSHTMEAVILQVKSGTLYIMETGENPRHEIAQLNMGEQGNIGYRKGQEILIYYDGTAVATAPAIITNVGKIEIIKEQTDKTIPDEYLSYYNSPEYQTYNLKASLSEITKTGIKFSITSEKELNSEDSESYKLFKTQKVYVGEEKKNAFVNSNSLGIPSNVIITNGIQKENFVADGESPTYVTNYNIDWSSTYGELEPFEERRI